MDRKGLGLAGFGGIRKIREGERERGKERQRKREKER